MAQTSARAATRAVMDWRYQADGGTSAGVVAMIENGTSSSQRAPKSSRSSRQAPSSNRARMPTVIATATPWSNGAKVTCSQSIVRAPGVRWVPLLCTTNGHHARPAAYDCARRSSM